MKILYKDITEYLINITIRNKVKISQVIQFFVEKNAYMHTGISCKHKLSFFSLLLQSVYYYYYYYLIVTKTISIKKIKIII